MLTLFFLELPCSWFGYLFSSRLRPRKQSSLNGPHLQFRPLWALVRKHCDAQLRNCFQGHFFGWLAAYPTLLFRLQYSSESAWLASSSTCKEGMIPVDLMRQTYLLPLQVYRIMDSLHCKLLSNFIPLYSSLWRWFLIVELGSLYHTTLLTLELFLMFSVGTMQT